MTGQVRVAVELAIRMLWTAVRKVLALLRTLFSGARDLLSAAVPDALASATRGLVGAIRDAASRLASRVADSSFAATCRSLVDTLVRLVTSNETVKKVVTLALLTALVHSACRDASVERSVQWWEGVCASFYANVEGFVCSVPHIGGVLCRLLRVAVVLAGSNLWEVQLLLRYVRSWCGAGSPTPLLLRGDAVPTYANLLQAHIVFPSRCAALPAALSSCI